MILPLRRLPLVAALALAAPGSARSQVAGAPTDSASARALAPRLIGSERDDRARLRQLTGLESGEGQLLRAPSQTVAFVPGTPRRPIVGPLFGESFLQANTELPWGPNTGPLWAGRGIGARLTLGTTVQWWRIRAVLAPQLSATSNSQYALQGERGWWFPPIDPPFSQYASPWNVSRWSATPYSIDLPWRYGHRAFARFDYGQSAIWSEAGDVAFGFASENEWWGPGLRTALILSNNAAGFPHLFARTRRPLRTRAGDFEMRWLTGRVLESAHFDTISTNNKRAVSAAALTWRPPRSDVTLGVSRLVIAPMRMSDRVWGNVVDFARPTGRPNARARSDTTFVPGRDQLFSVFGRWLLPADSAEMYFEVGRAELPRGFRDFLVAPNHTLAYVLGAQHVRPLPRGIGLLRIQGELANTEASTTWNARPGGSWYTSRAVRQGFTHDGKILGSWMGPGSSGQFVALDLLRDERRVGVYGGRLRWNSDAFWTMPWDVGQGVCEFDVTTYAGFRGVTGIGRYGTVSFDYTTGYRMNVFFQNNSGCPRRPGVNARDVRNRSFAVTFTPRFR